MDKYLMVSSQATAGLQGHPQRPVNEVADRVHRNRGRNRRRGRSDYRPRQHMELSQFIAAQVWNPNTCSLSPGSFDGPAARMEGLHVEFRLRRVIHF